MEPEQTPELDGPILCWSLSTTGDRFRYLALTGEIDMATEGFDGGELTVDLTAVDFMDTTGFHLLTRCAASLRRLDARLEVKVPPKGAVPRVLDLLDFSGGAIVADGGGANLSEH